MIIAIFRDKSNKISSVMEIENASRLYSLQHNMFDELGNHIKPEIKEIEDDGFEYFLIKHQKPDNVVYETDLTSIYNSLSSIENYVERLYKLSQPSITSIPQLTKGHVVEDYPAKNH